MKNATITLFFVLLTSAIWAQVSEPLKFVETVHDFGTIQEGDGPVTYEFQFTNNLDKPIKIINVKASCGCTTPDWSKEAVAPGAMGFIQAQYNPINRPYPFNKSLTVYTDAQSKPLVLFIKGIVNPKQKTIAEELPVKFGSLRFKYRNLNLGKVLTAEAATVKKFDFYNDGEEDVVVATIQKPEHIEVVLDRDTIKAKTKGIMEVHYNAKLKEDYGFLTDNITLVTNDSIAEPMSFNVYATIEEYFPPMTMDELAQAPKLGVSKLMHDFGKIKPDQTYTVKYYFKNNGKSKLNVRKVMGNCSCLQITLKDYDLDPGKSTEMTVVFNTTNRKGNQQKSVVIYSNDPKKPTQRVTLKAYIEN